LMLSLDIGAAIKYIISMHGFLNCLIRLSQATGCSFLHVFWLSALVRLGSCWLRACSYNRSRSLSKRSHLLFTGTSPRFLEHHSRSDLPALLAVRH
jgi:hypothetical protein